MNQQSDVIRKIDLALDKNKSTNTFIDNSDGSTVTKQKPFGMIRQAWDKTELSEIGLMDVFADTEQVLYEIKNGRRGTTGGCGDTTPDLVMKLKDISAKFSHIADNLQERYNESVGLSVKKHEASEPSKYSIKDEDDGDTD